MKKLVAFILCMALVITCVACFAACNPKKDDDFSVKQYDYDAISDTCTSADGKYEVAFVTDVGQLKDKSFNQGTWEGLKRYAYENSKTYKYYQPANGDQATDADRFNAMKAAVDNGAQIVVCAGFLQETALKQAASTYPDTKFVFIDGYPIGYDNVAPISYQEEQSGYLAGYAAVMEGYTKLGFAGGGGGANPACCRFGYGFLQGADAAAAVKNVDVTVKYSWLYGGAFGPSTELQTMLSGWYSTGTEVIFCCGGTMCKSAFAAASANQGKVIGVDVDQSAESSTVITSAMKGLRESVMIALGKFYEGKFSDLAGVSTVLGAADDAVGLPTATWSMKNFTLKDYTELFEKMKKGEIAVDNNADNYNKAYTHVTVEEIK